MTTHYRVKRYASWFLKEKIKRKDFFFPRVCLTSILQNSLKLTPANHKDSINLRCTSAQFELNLISWCVARQVLHHFPEQKRNKAEAVDDGQFTTAEARLKLNRPCPVILMLGISSQFMKP